MLRSRLSLVLALATAALAPSCGGSKPPAVAGAPKVDLDADPLALLPSAAIVVANVDAKALFGAPTIGPQIAELADKLVPLGADAGFEAKRDVDRIVVGSYAQGGNDVAAIVSGRFDEAKLAAATKSRSGAGITKATYAGMATYAVGQGAYVVLTGKTIVAGNPVAVHRVLDRIHDGKTGRAMPAWVVDTLQTPGAEIAAAGDFATQPLAAVAIGMVKLPWIAGVKEVRVLGDVKPPGMDVAATLTYGTGEQASAASDGVKSLGSMLNLLGPLIGGMSVHDLAVETKGSDMQCKFAVDDRTLEKLLSMAPRAIPGAK
jgi:hypothetical protein